MFAFDVLRRDAIVFCPGRSSEADFVLSDRSGNDDMEEPLNFNDITAGIHQLRMDSSEDVPDYKQVRDFAVTWCRLFATGYGLCADVVWR